MDITKTDICIVGSGIGGLTSGALLAKQGHKVTVLEAHDKVGGFASHFKRQGFSFEVAVHLIEGKGQYNPRDKIFDYLNVFELDFIESPSFYKIFFSDRSYSVPAHLESSLEFYLKNFPSEEQNINTFFNDLYAIAKEYKSFQERNTYIGPQNPMFSLLMPNFSRLTAKPIAQYLNELFKDKELIWTIMASIGFYNNSPLTYPTSFFLINTLFYLDGGAYYLGGGSQSLSNHLAKIIKENGGDIILGHRACHIKNNQLIFKKVKGVDTREHILSYNNIILNCSPEQSSKILNSKPKKISPSTSALCLYLGMSPDYIKNKATDLSYFNFFADLEQKDGRLSHSPLELSLVNYSILDKQFQKKPTIDVILLTPWDQWSEVSDDYEENKTIMLRRMQKRLDQLYPNLSSFTQISELATPITIHNFTHNDQGAIYGLDPNYLGNEEMLKRRWVGYTPKDDSLENVFYASAWSSTHGISGVVCAGYQAARAILEKEGKGFNLFH